MMNEVSKSDSDRDIIDLSQSREPDPQPAPASGSVVSSPIPAEEIDRITADVVVALKSVFDPEIPVDIYELGLIYKVDLEDDRTLKVQMTLTAPGCPVAGEMPGWVHDAVVKVDGVERAEVDLTFDPPWTIKNMSDEARLHLNML